MMYVVISRGKWDISTYGFALKLENYNKRENRLSIDNMNAQMLFVGGDFVLWWVCYVGLYFPPLFSLKVWVDPPYIGD
jgi:hypothetical protein